MGKTTLSVWDKWGISRGRGGEMTFSTGYPQVTTGSDFVRELELVREE
jgi:hypothetical protein